ncbi:hypothetical protein [Flavobacterium sp.]|uniref:hypothetical protein n=1 Tax=Flavobacterium sp. TaxID=239 RepID=UPI00286E8409|nr:hypothetical protein [Flavobacterium sp.]
MKTKLLFLFLNIPFISFSQSFDSKYTQFELSTPLKINSHRGETNADGSENEYFFLPDGLSAKIGYGIHFEEWVSVGFHTGIDWKAYEKLVAVPIFANFKLSPEITENGRIVLQFGIGKALTIGQKGKSGVYKRYNLGYQNSDGLLFFIDISTYNFSVNNSSSIGAFSVGIALVSF